MRIRHSLAIAILLVAPALAEVPAVVVQEGVLFDNRGAPLGGPVDLVFRLFDEPQGGQRIWQESHREVELVAGYYSVVLGADEALTPAVLDRATHFEVVADGGVLSPRIQLGSVPFALVARDVQGGTVDVTTIRIDGEEVINASGEWVGDPVGLRGAQGVAGVAGPQGPAGPAGAAGGQGEAGSPDTPAQVRDKLLQADGAGSGVDADLLDGIDSAAFVRVGAAIDATTFRGQAPAAFARTPQDVLGRLRQVDGAGSGVDADRLDGIDSSQFVRGAAQILGLLRGVDGSGSGLDADRLDGLDSGQFMRADTNTGTSGNLVVRGALSADSQIGRASCRERV